jgi:hypothetical protein
MYFELVSEIRETKVIAMGSSIRVRGRLRKTYGRAYWRRYKGVATVTLIDGAIRQAELHWYEAHGVGRREIKIKRFLDLPQRPLLILQRRIQKSRPSHLRRLLAPDAGLLRGTYRLVHPQKEQSFSFGLPGSPTCSRPLLVDS